MSRENSPSSEPLIDVIVLAGTKGTRALLIDGQPVMKPYLQVGGLALVCRVVVSALSARRVGKVFVVGDEEKLGVLLAELLERFTGRLQVVAEGEDLMDNGYRSFFRRLLPERGLGAPASENLEPVAVAEYQEEHPEARDVPVCVITSDLPFLSASSIDHFLAQDQYDSGLIFGLVDTDELDKMLAVSGDNAALDKWKLGAIHFRKQSIRPANLFLFRPLQVDPRLYFLINKLYSHRWLLKQDGSVHWKNWWAIARAMIGYSVRAAGFFRFCRGLMNFLPAMAAASLARKFHRFGAWLSWPFRQLVSKEDVVFIGSTMIGARGQVVVSSDPSSAIDIDVAESYQALIRDGERDFHRLLAYLDERSAAESAPEE